MNENPTTLSRILYGINHTLNIANKALPVYVQAKPLVKKGYDTYNNLKNNKDSFKNTIKLLKVKNQIKKDMAKPIPISNINITSKKKNNYSNTNNPKFFI